MCYPVEHPFSGDDIIVRACAPGDQPVEVKCVTSTENGQTGTVCACDTDLCNSAESYQTTTMPTTIQFNQTTTIATGTDVKSWLLLILLLILLLKLGN